ncbi:OLC1v1024409C1 [Oldenlandia corymbosa var. corymbosa]|uniref:OLC1v1024409C1 n=1 Tax=Oldenlandia corymbosa var. corymbosa TaxID=529605 RepID=A0AAV1C4J9_OLDCO|nr:OLC1v1024409C1 [Oldenlandia corymbosa var. corymbosa]
MGKQLDVAASRVSGYQKIPSHISVEVEIESPRKRNAHQDELDQPGIKYLAELLKSNNQHIGVEYRRIIEDQTLPLMHWTSRTHIEELEEKGCLVLYDVDVYTMNKHPDLKDIKFDVIVFNFPHAGHYSWLCERDAILIEKHKNLVSAYFKTAKQLLQGGGEIHVTTRDDEPYNTWEVEKLAINEGFKPEREG